MRSNPQWSSPATRWLLMILLSAAVYFIKYVKYVAPPAAETPPRPAGLDSTAAVPEPPALRVIDHTIAHGQTLAQILSTRYVRPEDVFPTIAALRSIFDPRHLRAGRPLQLKLDSLGTLHELAYQPSPELVIRVQRDSTNRFIGAADSLRLEREVKLLAGEVTATLYEAVMAQQESPELLLQYTDIFQWDIDFFIDTQRGDRFRILFEKLYVEKEPGRREFVRYGRILAASYEQQDSSCMAFLFDPDSSGRGGYFDRQGNSFQKTFLKSPLNYRRISSHFSNGRLHPILRKVRAHTGVDFAAATGTPVVATANGTVAALGWEGGYGKRVVIQHKNHFSTLYGHLSRFAEGLQVGQMVSQSQVIGYVGATGLATGPHLHYTMYLNGRAIDPLRMKPAAADPIAPHLRQAFFAHRDRLLQQLQSPAPLFVVGSEMKMAARK
ncbi:MAG: M23 family metallopeptidase [candidate division KSB1 bacterium]|nr:M23 family metallopeptidase [candidate division KSB1 bacterium]MDZ7275727.1 M23 family metallopeptidase [candidate division KSB1 bacterium]MDZ7284582.1 M23 family metallopeptidase [candidate division KSB1 bacterium]MDZ7297999.1 M23 family metallopeptidase [candidate division KSB1 bacterium]MDZ7305833.1 M23 family metallopeptidase [candidate division KSB1 bacterium]